MKCHCEALPTSVWALQVVAYLATGRPVKWSQFGNDSYWKRRWKIFCYLSRDTFFVFSALVIFQTVLFLLSSQTNGRMEFWEGYLLASSMPFLCLLSEQASWLHISFWYLLLLASVQTASTLQHFSQSAANLLLLMLQMFSLVWCAFPAFAISGQRIHPFSITKWL